MQWGDERQEDQFGGCCNEVKDNGQKKKKKKKDNGQDAHQGSKGREKEGILAEWWHIRQNADALG